MKQTLDPRMGEEIYRDRLVGGFDFWAVPRGGSRQKSAVLSVDFGSVDVELSAVKTGQKMALPAGTAHFIEHRLFEKSYGDITDRFNGLGGDINASTSFSSTIFTLTCLENFAENLALLFELVFELQVTAKGVDREREIIERELRMGSDDPEWVGFLRGLDALYGAVPLTVDMAGTEQSIAAIDMDLLAICHEACYRPQHMGLYLCGDFDCAEIGNLLGENLQKYQRREPQWQKVDRPLALPTPLASAAIELPINRPYALFFFADERVGLHGPELLRRELAYEMALDIAFGPASDFFATHYGEGLTVGDDFGAEVYAEPSFCFCVVGGYTLHARELAEVVEVTLKNTGDQVERDFRRAKHKAYGQLLRSCERAEEVADLLCSAAINRAEPSDYFDIYEEITIDDVNEVLKGCLASGPQGTIHIRPHAQASNGG